MCILLCKIIHSSWWLAFHYRLTEISATLLYANGEPDLCRLQLPGYAPDRRLLSQLLVSWKGSLLPKIVDQLLSKQFLFIYCQTVTATCTLFCFMCYWIMINIKKSTLTMYNNSTMHWLSTKPLWNIGPIAIAFLNMYCILVNVVFFFSFLWAYSLGTDVNQTPIPS